MGHFMHWVECATILGTDLAGFGQINNVYHTLYPYGLAILFLGALSPRNSQKGP